MRMRNNTVALALEVKMAAGWQRAANHLRAGYRWFTGGQGARVAESRGKGARSPRFYGAVAAAGVVAGYSMVSLAAAEMELHPPKYAWSHRGLFSALDHQSVRRGYQVYKEVCAACHSMQYIKFRNLVGVSHTEEEARVIAEEFEYPGDNDEEGNPTTRPGKLSDPFPEPYPNEEAAKFANNGALPPDLSLVLLGREGNDDYIFSILTGYFDPPEGVEVREGMAYNPYFPGGVIGMPQQLFLDSVEYEDGTPATVSQMAKDMTTFLRWTSEPYHDDRKRIGFKVIIILSCLALVGFYWKRRVWSVLKSRKVVYYSKGTKS